MAWMNRSQTEILAALGRCRESIAAALRQTDDPAQRAALLTETLRSLWPAAPLYACLLWQEGRPALNVRDEAGRSRSDWADLIGDDLGRREGPGRVPAALNVPAKILLRQEIALSSRCHGILAVALAKGTTPARDAGARALLAVAAGLLAACLELETLERDRQALRDELTEEAWMATIGDLVGPVGHELNNYLNVLLLHVAVLEQQLPPDQRSELAEVRRQAAGITALVKQLQQYRRRRQTALRPVDLQRVLVDAIEALGRASSESDIGPAIRLASPDGEQTDIADQDVVVRLAPAADLPLVLGSVRDLKQLVTFVVMNAAAAQASGGGSITIRTERAGAQVVLRVEDSGPSLSPQELQQFFEPGGVGREGTHRLELAACESLVRRLKGKIHAEEQAGGGVAVVVQLPAAACG